MEQLITHPPERDLKMTEEHQSIECHVFRIIFWKQMFCYTQGYKSWKPKMFHRKYVFFLMTSFSKGVVMPNWVHCDHWVRLKYFPRKVLTCIMLCRFVPCIDHSRQLNKTRFFTSCSFCNIEQIRCIFPNASSWFTKTAVSLE